jgi:Zn-dependent peptidase ImmA (M78 family)/DNA-binding XRE family transcriptional regulator
MPVTQEELGKRIRAAREACGFTQEAIAARIGVSRPAVVQMESGQRSVSSLELDRLAFALGRDIREFVSDEFQAEDTLTALFRAEGEALGDPDVLEHLRACIAIGRELTNLERLIGIAEEVPVMAQYPVLAPARRWEAIEQGERIAEEERRRLGLGAGPLPEIGELLEAQGVRAGLIDLPADVSGLMLHDRSFGLFVIANRRHPVLRRRFSLAHEYAHVVADRERFGLVSRASERSNLVEVRANAFAASFLMPEEGVRQFMAGLGKGKPSRASSEVFDEAGSINVEGRTEPGTQAIQLYDVVQLAHHFKVSRIAALFRLRNLRLVSDAEFASLRDQDELGEGKLFADLFGLAEPEDEARHEFRHRVTALALEAYRREEISAGKLREVASMVGVSWEDLEQLLASDEPPPEGTRA